MLQTSEFSCPLDPALAQEIERFVLAQSGGHYMQTPRWLEIASSPRARLFVSRDAAGDVVATSITEEIRGRMPWVRTAEIARGPVVLHAVHMAPHLHDVLARVRPDVVSLRINPLLPAESKADIEAAVHAAGFKGVGSNRLYNHTLIVEICPAEATQWQRLRRSTRTAINKSERLGIVVRQENDVEAYREFAKSYTRFARARGLGLLDEARAERLRSQFALEKPPLACLLSAVHGGEIVAQILLVRNRTTLIYEWGWTSSSAEHQHMPLMHGLMWRALTLGRDTGCEHFDLGGYWYDRLPSDPSNHFKLGFGKTVVTFAGSYKFVCSPALHTMQALAGTVRSTLERAGLPRR